ncbi:hypothetical protein AMTRI_Chr01g126780 [Amborella trichopoda]
MNGDFTYPHHRPKFIACNNFIQLEKLNIILCVRLVAILELPSSLKYLYASRCKILQTMPKVSHLFQLEKLKVTSRELLVAIAELLNSLKLPLADSCKSLQVIPKLSHLSQQQVLSLAKCEQLVALPELPSTIVELSNGLKHLNASTCKSLIPKLSHLSELNYLNDSYCEQLVAIPELSSSLKYLNASQCKSLQMMLPTIYRCKPNLSHLSQLENLDLRYCKRLTEVQIEMWVLQICSRIRLCRSQCRDF